MKPLNDLQWGEFRIKNIFEINKGIYLNEKKILKGNIPFITAKSEKNGLNKFIGNESLFKGNSITIEKINLSAFYQKSEFYCSHDVTVITNSNLNRFNALFICNIINRQGSKYSYGRQAQMNIVKNETLFLPIQTNGQPDYEYMENYTKLIECKKLKEFLNYIN